MTSALHRRLLDQSTNPPKNIIATAHLGCDPADKLRNQIYRYDLRRTWDLSKKILLYVMLNPSTADSYQDDPTIRVCMARASMMGFGGIRVVNLFAYRATSPAELYLRLQERNYDYIIGPENDQWIGLALEDIQTGAVLCAWGGNGKLLDRGRDVHKLIESYSWSPMVIDLTKDGEPVHPLRQSYNKEPIAWRSLGGG